MKKTNSIQVFIIVFGVVAAQALVLLAAVFCRCCHSVRKNLVSRQMCKWNCSKLVVALQQHWKKYFIAFTTIKKSRNKYVDFIYIFFDLFFEKARHRNNGFFIRLGNFAFWQEQIWRFLVNDLLNALLSPPMRYENHYAKSFFFCHFFYRP